MAGILDEKPATAGLLGPYLREIIAGLLSENVAPSRGPPATFEQGVAPLADPAAMRQFSPAEFAMAIAGGPKLMRSGIRAYHGSPYDFERFDLSKIGSGEGAQAYGHGLYFAENEATAKVYRDQLAPTRTYHGSEVLTGPAENAASILTDRGGDKRAALAFIDSIRGVRGASKSWLDETADAVRRLDPAKIERRADPGSMYEVNINARPEQFLDWDRPLSQQPELVQQMARESDLSNLKPGNRTRVMMERFRSGTEEPHNPTLGHHFYNSLSDYGSRGTPELTAQLREAGIPGIKYLDQGSRAAGEGSRNYVVFDANLIDILRKYGLLGMLGGGAAAAGSQDR